MSTFGSVNGSVAATGGNNAFVFDCSPYGALGIDVRGTFTATLIFEGTVDNTNWFTLTVNPQAGGAGVTSVTAAGTWFVNIPGMARVRARADAYTSGTATVVFHAIPTVGTTTNVTVTADTEFPAAAALADNTANPTTTLVGSCTMAFDGTTWDRVTNGAGTAATAMRTTLASDDPAVVAVQIIDDWDESDRAKVNPIVGQAGIAAGAGAVGVTVPRVTLASDDPAVTALQLIDNAVSGAGFNITQFGGAAVPIGAGVEATAVRVTLPTDGTGVVGITGAALTALQLIDNIVSGAGVNVTQVNGEAIDVGAGTEAAAIRVTLPTDGTGKVLAAQSGTWTEANSASITTAVQIMDDWDNAASDGASVSGDVAHDSGDAGEPVKIGGKALTAVPTAVTANDRVNAQFDVYGRQVMINALREMKGAQHTTITSSTSETTVVTADATYKLDAYAVWCTNTSATATEVSFKDSTAGTTRFMISVPANDMRGFCLPMDAGHNQNAANNNWTATCADSVASILITVLFVKNL